MIIVTNPGILQVEFERTQFRRILAEAQRMLKSIEKDKNRWAYVYAPESDFAGIRNDVQFLAERLDAGSQQGIRGSQAKHWDEACQEDDSRGEGEAGQGPAKSGFFSWGDRQDAGVSKSTVKNYLDCHPYHKRCHTLLRIHRL